jgi:membrane dipeptidase
MLIFDAHLDLAMNAMEWNRDLRRPIHEIREREQPLKDKPDRGRGTVCFGEMRRGGVGLCVATQIARYVKPANRLPGWQSPEQAWAQTQGQLAWYRAMEEAGELVQIRNVKELNKHVESWEQPPKGPAQSLDSASPPPSPPLEEWAGERRLPIGYILSLEGADSIISMRHLELAHGQGLRALGPAHYGPGTYAQGTDASGGLGPRGRELLKEMGRLGIILDVTHLCDESFWEAVEAFEGPLWASHSNCRALVPHARQLADEQIKYLVERGAVIGAALDAWMLVPGWVRSETKPESVGLKLERVIEHLDRVCQIAGNAQHCGIGSDLDGAFGREQCPADVETIADLGRLPELLKARGYNDSDIGAIMHGNFLRFLGKAWI